MTTLQVPAQLGISDVEAAALVEVWSTADVVATRMMKLGFSPPQRPPVQPPQLSPGQQVNFTPQQFEMHTQLLEDWQGYAQYHMVMLKNYIEELENKKEILKLAQVKTLREWYRNNPGDKKPAEVEISESVKHSPVWQELHKEQQDCNHAYRLVEQAFNSYSRQKGVLSRGLTAKQVAQAGR